MSSPSDAVVPPFRHLLVQRTARYYLLGDERAPRELWVVLHGYGQLAGRFLRHFTAIDDGSRLIAAPEGLSRFYLEHPGRAGAAHTRVGATWMTREDRDAEIADQVRYLDAVCDDLLASTSGVRPSLHVLGFSQGVATATRWLAHGRTRADHLVLWAGRMPHDLLPIAERHPLRRVTLDVVTGEQDEFATPEVLAEQRALFAEAGLQPRTHRYPGGHRIHAPTLRELAARARR